MNFQIGCAVFKYMKESFILHETTQFTICYWVYLLRNKYEVIISNRVNFYIYIHLNI